MIANGSGEADPQFVAPQFSHLDLANTVLHNLVLTDEQRALVQDGAHDSLARVIGMRRVLYTSALRSVALERRGRSEEAAELARRASRTLAMLNNIEQAWTSSQNPRLDPNTPQDGMRLAVRDFLRSHPKENQYPGVNPDAIHGLTIVAPNTPGMGAALGRIVAECGIGTQPNTHDTQPLTAAIIVPGHEQQDEFAGLTSKREFARFSNIRPTRYIEDAADSPLTVVTEEMFIQNFQNGRLGNRVIDLLVITNAHHLTGQRLRSAIRSGWDGPLISTTATPMYNKRQDVRKILTHTFEHGDLLTYTENGLLNGAQLLTIPIEPKNYAHQLPEEIDLEDPILRSLYGREYVNQAAVDLAVAQITQGKRGIIVCERGGGSEQARNIAELLAEHSLPVASETTVGDEYGELETEPIVARVLSTENTQEDNQEARKLFRTGEVQVLTTANMGKDAADLGEVNFIIFAAPRGIHSRVKLERFMQHGTPHSKAHPCTLYAEIFVALTGNDESIASIWDAYRQQTIRQGVRIMPKTTPEHRAGAAAPASSADQPDALEAPSEPLPSPAGPAREPIERGPQLFKRPSSAPEYQLDLSDLPEYLQYSIREVDAKPLREITIGQDEVIIPPEYSFKLSSLLASQNIPEQWAIKRLERAGFDYKARRETITEGEREGERVTEHYFKPEAREWLAHNPMPPRATADFTSENQLCIRAKAPQSVVRRLAQAANIQRLELLNSQNIDTNYYGNEDAADLERAIAAIPAAKPTDRTTQALVKELNNSEAFVRRMRLTNPMPTILMRNADGNGFGEYLPDAETLRIKTAWFKYPVADPTDYSIYRMAREAGISRRALKGRLDPEDYAAGQIKRSPSGAIMHFSAAVAPKLIEKAKSDVLPYHLIPIRAVASTRAKPRYIGTTDTTIRSKYGDRIMNLRLPSVAGETGCIDWNTLRELEAKYGRIADFTIRYKDLPTGPDDTNEKRLRYAREVQRRLMLAAQLQNVRDPWEIKPEVPVAASHSTKADTAPDPPSAPSTTNETPPPPQSAPATPSPVSSPNQAAAALYPERASNKDGPLTETRAMQLRKMVEQGGHYTGAKRAERRAASPPQEVDYLAAPQVAQAFTALQIATRVKVPHGEVVAAIQKLKDEFKAPDPTVVEGITQVRYSGAYLDAILTEVVGLTPEAIARRAGVSELSGAVKAYLKNNHDPHPNRRGRYTRKALLAAIAAFNPPDTYIPLATAMRAYNQTKDALLGASHTLELPIRFYYNERGQEPYIHVDAAANAAT